MKSLPTCKIVVENPRGYNIINRRDFDPDEHTLHEDNPQEVFDVLGRPRSSSAEESSSSAASEPETGAGVSVEEESGEPDAGSTESGVAGDQESALDFGDLPKSEALREAGYETIEAVREASDEELEEVGGIGTKTREKIREAL